MMDAYTRIALDRWLATEPDWYTSDVGRFYRARNVGQPRQEAHCIAMVGIGASRARRTEQQQRAQAIYAEAHAIYFDPPAADAVEAHRLTLATTADIEAAMAAEKEVV